jgi:hypothetical protein
MVLGTDSKSVKIVIAGPLKSGKSTIANFLADEGDNLRGSTYTPTVGVRYKHLSLRSISYMECWCHSHRRPCSGSTLCCHPRLIVQCARGKGGHLETTLMPLLSLSCQNTGV